MARFRRRNDAEAHLQILQRLMPEAVLQYLREIWAKHRDYLRSLPEQASF